MDQPVTPDGRYFVVRGRLWRLANPALSEDAKSNLVQDLMRARRALRSERNAAARIELRRQVDSTKVALGERGPVWWDDGAADLNRKLVKNTPYAQWFEDLGQREARSKRRPFNIGLDGARHQALESARSDLGRQRR